MKTLPISLSLFVVLALAGCNRQSSDTTQAPEAVPVKVTDVTLGRSLTPEKTIGDKTDSFSPSDTIYVTVKTVGSASSAELQARWSFEDGQIIDDSRQTVTPTTNGVMSEFHVSKPDGWPAGKYKVEILVGGKLAESREFKVS